METTFVRLESLTYFGSGYAGLGNRYRILHTNIFDFSESVMTETESLNQDSADIEIADALLEIVRRCEQVMAHAWMVRTFIKHSDEAEDFPELMGLARIIFDLSRALETRINDPASYLKMLRKKIAKLKKASLEFEKDAPLASMHTNFQQAVCSINACCEQLQYYLDEGTELLN